MGTNSIDLPWAPSSKTTLWSRPRGHYWTKDLGRERVREERVPGAWVARTLLSSGEKGARRLDTRPTLAVAPSQRQAGRRRPVTEALYRETRDQELQALGGPDQGHLRQAVELLDALVLSRDFVPFLTTEAYQYLE